METLDRIKEQAKADFKEAKRLSIIKWELISGPCAGYSIMQSCLDKSQQEKYQEIRNLPRECGFCTYYSYRPGVSGLCRLCPLDVMGQNCNKSSSIFTKWGYCNKSSYELKAKYSLEMLNFIKELTWENYLASLKTMGLKHIVSLIQGIPMEKLPLWIQIIMQETNKTKKQRKS